MEYINNQQSLRHLISVPFIWMLIIPLVILDIFVEIYHHICFPLYGIPLVKRSNYIKIDRHKLEYLTPRDKINCAYCGYANGLLHYSAEIAGRTEKYWCAIKHKEEGDFIPLKHHNDFLEYGNERSFKMKYPRPQESIIGTKIPLNELLGRVLKGVLPSK